MKALQKTTSLIDELLAKVQDPSRLASTVLDNLWLKGTLLHHEISAAQTEDLHKAGLHYGAAFSLLILD
jgi:hypothetical protein